MEKFLNLCLGKLAGFNDLKDPTPFILLIHSSFPQRLDILGTLCEQLVAVEAHLKDYKKVINLFKEAQRRRNNLMHYGMVANPQSGRFEMPIATARGTLKLSVEKVDLADVRRASMAIDEANRALYKLVLQRDLPPAWMAERQGK